MFQGFPRLFGPRVTDKWQGQNPRASGEVTGRDSQSVGDRSGKERRKEGRSTGELASHRLPDLPADNSPENRSAALRTLLSALPEAEARRLLNPLSVQKHLLKQVRIYQDALKLREDKRGIFRWSDSHKMTCSALVEALFVNEAEELVGKRSSANDTLAPRPYMHMQAQEVVRRLCKQAVENLENHNIKKPVYRLSATLTDSEAKTRLHRRNSIEREIALSKLVLAAIAMSSEHNKWAFQVMTTVFEDCAILTMDGQLHLGPSADLYFIGIAVDIKYMRPELSDAVTSWLQTFLPREHISLFLREYVKQFGPKHSASHNEKARQ